MSNGGFWLEAAVPPRKIYVRLAPEIGRPENVGAAANGHRPIGNQAAVTRSNVDAPQPTCWQIENITDATKAAIKDMPAADIWR